MNSLLKTRPIEIIPMLLVVGTCLDLDNNQDIYIKITVWAISIFLLFLHICSDKNNKFRINKQFTFYLSSLFVVATLSNIITLSISNTVRIIFLILIFTTIFFAAYRGRPLIVYSNLIKGIKITVPILFFICLIQSGFNLNNFHGFYGKPVYIVRLCAFLFPVFWYEFIRSFKLEKRLTLDNFFLLSQSILCLLFVFFSESRACHVITIAGILLIILSNNLSLRMYFLNILSTRNLINFLKFFLITSLIISALVYFGAFERVINKSLYLSEISGATSFIPPSNQRNFIEKYGDDSIGISNGRFTFWLIGLDILKTHFFGVPYGSEQASSLGIIRLDLHNNYLNFALRYGIFTSIIFHSMFFYICQYFLFNRRRSTISKLGFVMTSQMLLFWLFETATLLSPVYIILTLYAISIKDSPVNQINN